MKERINLIGQKFERLLVLERANRNNNPYLYKCVCDCGKEFIAGQYNLKRGTARSCGCIKIELMIKRQLKHGMCNTRRYRIWRKMLDRCGNTKHKAYKWYGGRGIKVCEQWHSFENFYNDTILGYADNLTLDRYPNKNGDYDKNNFRWATIKQQQRNKNSNVYLEYNGERLTHIEWSEKLGWNPKIISERVKSGWPTERVLSEPIYFSKGKNQFGNSKISKSCLQVSL